MKQSVLALLIFLYFSACAQNTINNYKYVIVPQKFSFLKQNDQYALNSITKASLDDKGFKAYFDNDDLPAELANNKCNALLADVLDKSGMFSTTLTLVLKDCQGNIVFKSKEGKSREKDFREAYTMALRDAFASLNQVAYAYNGPANVQPTPSATVAVATPVISTPVKLSETVPAQPAGTLYAQAIANGFQLIDTTPKIVLTLMKTSAENYFIASNAIANGIVLKKNGEWFFEYYKDGALVSEKLMVKF